MSGWLTLAHGAAQSYGRRPQTKWAGADVSRPAPAPWR